MGNADWSEKQAVKALAAIGVPEPPYNTLHSRIRAGQQGKDYYGPVPKLKRSQADALTALLTDPKKSKKKGVKK
jgi:hypothetical protein